MTDKSQTVIDALVEALNNAAGFNSNDAAAPVTILWTDKERHFQKLIPRLRSILPILTLGKYDPTSLTGPSIWLKCVLARTLSVPGLTEGVPIVYLPNISRQEIRAVDTSPRELVPLLELQYRGAFFTHRNHRDWTPHSFLQGHLNIKVAEDYATREALGRALAVLADEAVDVLRAAPQLDAAVLNALLNPDPGRQLLAWMNQPEEEKRRIMREDPGRWKGFVGVCKRDFGLDPDADGPVTAAQRLAEGKAGWAAVWARFKDAPQRYPHLPDLMRRARPQDTLFSSSEAWPQDTDAAENQLLQALMSLQGTPAPEACRTITELEAAHGNRRSWVWSELGMAPLAQSLEHLAALADATAAPLGSGTPTEIAERYMTNGWRSDLAALDALASGVTPNQTSAIQVAVEAIYRPWLEESARAFQQAVMLHGLPKLEPEAGAAPGRCILFTDGLRFDVAEALKDELKRRGLNVAGAWRFGAAPGVTATAKPAASPIAQKLTGGKEFNAALVGSQVNANVLRRELNSAGFEIVTDPSEGDVAGSGWAEYGNLDAIGHAEGWRLSKRFRQEAKNIADFIEALLEHGWQEVRVITDHGWLLLPNGLKKVDLPEHLTEARKGRCARMKPSSTTDLQTVPWHFDSTVLMAIAPGITAFVAGKDYEHGGLSPQESVLPALLVTSAVTTSTTLVEISSLKWVGLLYKVAIIGAAEGLSADLRTKAGDRASSVLEGGAGKPFSGVGQVTLAADDSHEGEAVHLVVLDNNGIVVLQRVTTVGGP